jgi:beta-galactosidase
VFNQAQGLTEFGIDGHNLIQRGPLLNVWRPATDNDGLKLRPRADHSDALSRWLDLGLNAVQHSYVRLVLRQLNPPTVEMLHYVSGRQKWDDFRHSHRYQLLPSGELLVDNTVRLGQGLVDLPRVGVSLILVPGLEQLAWFGRGPWENYADRKASASVARYRSTVTEQYVPYIMPQENGHKTDVRWLELRGANGSGLRAEGRPTFEFSASHFSDDDLFRAKHTHELVPRPEVILNLDHAQRGLGTASCGPDTLRQYQLRERVYRFAFTLRPLQP